MAEFREQDSYVNSDYDSDSDFECDQDVQTRQQHQGLTNSLIKQARVLADAASQFRRPQGLPQPRVRFVLTRLSSEPLGGGDYPDARIGQTFQAIRDMGVDLVLADQLPRNLPGPSSSSPTRKQVLPTRNVVLDLSVLVALCCDSTHHLLPSTEQELEARFRALQVSDTGNEAKAKLELAPHNNVTRDLRDQLSWEYEHALIGELQSQLEQRRLRDMNNSDGPEEVQFWVTEEVKGRLPNIVEVIGGDKEKARARAMFRNCHTANGQEQEDDDDGVELDFWEHSRWKGKAPDLGNLRIKILPDDDHSHEVSATPDSPTGSENHAPTAHVQVQVPFHLRLMRACENILAAPSDTVLPPTPLHKQKHKQKLRGSKHPARAGTVFPTSRSPSPHTLNTFIAGARRGWTVLTNNRGAVGKIVRDMGVLDGIPFDHHQGQEDDQDAWAVVWVVNPSSLSEWRRIEVEISNNAVTAAAATTATQAANGHASS